MGWASREPLLGSCTHLVTSNGLFQEVILVNGRAVGTWTRTRARVELEAFEPLDDRVLTALAAEAADVERFLGFPQI